MSIVDRQSLESAIESYSHRSDLSGIYAIIIAAAESRINRSVRCRNMEVKITTTISNSYYPLPSDFIKLNSIQLGDRIPINLKSESQQDEDRASGELGYAIQNGNIEIRPTVVDTLDFEFSYFAKVAPLVNPSDTTDMLVEFPMIYLYAAMIDVAMYIQDDQRVNMWEQSFIKEIELINEDAQQAKYSGTPLRIRGN